MASPEQEKQLSWMEIEAALQEAEALPVPAEPPRTPRLKAIERNQMILRSVVVEDLLEPDHTARAI